ncbi:excinuclease ABC subunit UvrA [Pendulispora albinea]|uniref:UvrABC system protein A n=1 Tax=Pendulispora albinea TaxID=2741071 RepID=A0ABZ2LNQ3_9BACT
MLPVVLRGARTHNLRHVDLTLSPGQLVAVTGRSGAGKSSLALDTLYAEGQRRFVESFSPYARQFLERLERPPIDRLDPIAATVAVDRRAPIKSSRSTLATMADLEPYFAGLFAREAVPTCPDCGVSAVATTPEQAARALTGKLAGSKATVSYPIRAQDPAHFFELRENLVHDGYRRLMVAGTVRDIDDVRPSEATAPDIRVEVLLDRLVVRQEDERRLQQAIELAWERGEGRAELRVDAAGELFPESLFGKSGTTSGASTGHVPVVRGLACPSCARAFEPSRPALFSYNSPLGACEACRGFGRTIEIDWDKVIPDPSRSIEDGAIRAWTGNSSEWERGVLSKFCKKQRIPVDVPWEDLAPAQRAMVIEGEGTWEGGKYPGVRAWFKWLESRTYKMHVRVFLSRYRDYVACTSCQASRLNKTALAYRVGGLNLADWHGLAVSDALARILEVKVRDPQGKRLREELAARLGYLDAVGLGYLTLDRQARTLSGGEAQRAGLTTALGASLTGALFVLDEPTVGLHPSDVPALAKVMRRLSDAGNTVMVIEHDTEVVRACDRVIELGPGAGKEGGQILFDGSPAGLAARADLPTGRALAAGAARAADGGKKRRAVTDDVIAVRGARANNLAGVDVDFPLGTVCVVTGPSGSGKSTLVEEILYRGVARKLGDTKVPRPGEHDALTGTEPIARVCLVDQAPLGRTARGNAATYTKAWDRFRALFADTPEAKARKFTASHFSFNVGGDGTRSGRCEACAGEGYETVEMQFLADVTLLCAVCQGKRFRPEVLAVKYRGYDISQVLEMTAAEALRIFDPPSQRDYVLRRALDPVLRVGLGYLPLGQPLSMLSGGEAQRLKLARALTETAQGTLFVIDEPSAGLHAEDTVAIIDALSSLVDEGASVVVVEHDLDIVRSADWVIDLGPGAGPRGGKIVAFGTPEHLAAKSGSKTGAALRASSSEAPDLPTRTATSEERRDWKGERESPKETHDGRQAGASREERAQIHAVTVEHAREHNLKSVSCKIPHGALCVITGPSGSGKSSLAFDVVFAEGQRRFMETLTPYARQFLPMLPRPDVERVTGVPPSIALEQRLSRAGSNSTVATVTEVAHYLRLLYAKVGELHCPKCDAVVATVSPDELFARLAPEHGRGKHTIFAPAVRARKGTYKDLFTLASRAGISEAWVDGELVAIDPPPKLAKTKEHTIDLLVYTGSLDALDRKTFDTALGFGNGALRVVRGRPDLVDGDARIWSTSQSCSQCGTGVPELDPRWFSFNTKQGQCESCEGTGLLPGDDDEDLAHRARCPVCEGTRLSAVPRRVRLQGETYPDFVGHDVATALATARKWKFQGRDLEVARAPHAELLRRLSFVVDVGLGYLSMDRAAATLSGGEMQRLRLSAQLGSGLTGALYVLDEPTIGLHPRDTKNLLGNLRSLVDTGSTVVVVEHDAETIKSADHLIDLGPSGGRLGGHIVAEGPAARVLGDPRSPTGRALVETARVVRPARPPADKLIELTGARAHNLKGVDLRVPTGRMTVVAGVSGSGKSTLVRKVFYPALRRELGLVGDEPGRFSSLKGAKNVRRALAVDQSPIGRTPRSVPATFLGIWDDIRRLFASLPEAKVRGYTPARFSFNAGKGGRCPACEGQGATVAEMAFLPDVVSPCEACGGARFEPSTLDIRYAGLTIGDVLHLSAEDAANVFAAHPKIARPLATLVELGVGYVQLGQGSNTLSGGEAQRLKLASELTAGVAHEPTVYVLDEPTTGLHLTDVRRLIVTLERLVARGDTLLIIEHHPDMIASADWVIELGPEGGAGGGEIVFEGTPAQLARAKTATGRYFAEERRAARNGNGSSSRAASTTPAT